MRLDLNSDEYRQAALSINFELEANFRRNLLFFSKRDTSLYYKFKNYKPSELTLRLSEEGYLNLYNIETGQPVYNESPDVYVKKQVDEFFEKRPTVALNLNIHRFEYDDFSYSACLNNISDKYKSYVRDKHPDEENIVPMLFMLGGGLFLQLEDLLNNLDIKRLCIFDNSFDAFYLSLHLIDWEQIFKYFDRPGYSLNIFHLKSGEDPLHKIYEYIHRIGLYSMPRYEVYRHYTNEALDNVYDYIQSYVINSVGSAGYFDDERVGLRHTLHNVNSNLQFYKKSNRINASNDAKVVIVGNGPSIDENIDWLEKNKNSVLIVSCGTALDTLTRYGIRPDIHMEQERLDKVVDNLNNVTDVSVFNDVILFGLNTCHPDTFSKFKNSYGFFKISDLGTTAVRHFDSHAEPLNFCNPIVANFALSAMTELGFKNFVLIGVDCGMKSLKKHHSIKSSIHFDEYGVDDKKRTKHIMSSGYFRVPGVDKDEVYTTSVMNFSRINLEKIIKRSGLDVVNLSNGARISGTYELNDLELVEALDKEKLIQNIVAPFETVDKYDLKIQIELLKEEFLHVCGFFKEIFSRVKDKDRNDFLLEMKEIHDEFNRFEISSPLGFFIMKGSFYSLCFELSVGRFNLTNGQYSGFFDCYVSEVNAFIDSSLCLVNDSLN